MPGPYKSALTEGRGIKQKITEGSIMKTKFSKLFVTILIVAAVTCCGALGVFAADDAKAATAFMPFSPSPPASHSMSRASSSRSE